MDRSSQHSLLNPATCFSIVCVVFSIAAVSVVWRSQGSNIDAPLSLPKGRRPNAVRRKGVDSVYLGPGGIDLHDPEPAKDEQINVPVVQSPLVGLGKLIALCAEVSKSLRSNRQLACSRLVSSSLLGEISSITTTLCRLQQQLATSSVWFTEGSGISACFEACATGLSETLLLLRSELLRTTGGDDEVWRTALEQLRSHKPTLEFLLESSTVNSPPPTPPTEEDGDETLVPESLLPTPVAVGITPAPDAGGWMDAPPAYSLPANGTIHLAEKADAKVDAGPPELHFEPEQTVIEDDALFAAVTSNEPDLPLHQAAHLNHTACLPILLRHGALMSLEDVKGDTSLHLAAWAGNVEALSTLLAHGADVDWLSGRDGYSPLWCAITGYHIDAARLLLKHGARVSLRSASGGGLMPLHQAAITAQSAMCELLLERGAQVNSVDEDGNTALHYAAVCGSATVVKVLLRSGAQVDLEQAQGLTPAHWAAHKGHNDVLAMLLDYGAPVNATAEDGATPLHMAANRGHLACVRLLLEKGAKRKVRATWDGSEGTAAEMAKLKGHARVAKAISDHGMT